VCTGFHYPVTKFCYGASDLWGKYLVLAARQHHLQKSSSTYSSVLILYLYTTPPFLNARYSRTARYSIAMVLNKFLLVKRWLARPSLSPRASALSDPEAHHVRLRSRIPQWLKAIPKCFTARPAYDSYIACRICSLLSICICRHLPHNYYLIHHGTLKRRESAPGAIHPG
jgi:hypothetical protein